MHFKAQEGDDTGTFAEGWLTSINRYRRLSAAGRL
jgi:hypothetical protein